MSEITLPSGRKIGPGHPPFIIAEIGSNFRRLEDCRNSIVQAKACGADAVKFQAYSYEALYGIPDQLDGTVRGQLPLGWIPAMADKAKAVGIEFMCSAFSPELIDAVDPYVSIHKVASAECTHKRMLERLRAIGKPVFLSTGAHGVEDIRMALQMLGHAGPDGPATPTVLLYCVAAYPAREIDLYQLHTIRGCFGTMAGYSDHSTDVENIPVLAQSHGAVVIEKHVTFIDAETPDSPHSLSGDEFKRMVFAIRRHKYESLDTPPDIFSGWKGPVGGEKPMVLRHNRRILATRDIPAGEQITEGSNAGIYRSLKDDTHAFSPFMIDEVNGRTAKRAIKAGDGIGPGDI